MQDPFNAADLIGQHPPININERKITTRNQLDMRVIGKPTARVEGVEKVTGAAKYAA